MQMQLINMDIEPSKNQPQYNIQKPPCPCRLQRGVPLYFPDPKCDSQHGIDTSNNRGQTVIVDRALKNLCLKNIIQNWYNRTK